MHIALHAAGKVGHSDRVMAAEESIIDVLLDHFQPATSHISLTHCFNLLQAVLLTERIKRVIDPIEQIDKLSPGILLHQLVKAFNIDKDDCDFTL